MAVKFSWPSEWNWTKEKILLISLITVGVALLVSLIVFFWGGSHLTRTVLFFPNQISKKISGEARFLPYNADKEKNIELLVKEILLGPADNTNLSLFPRDGRVNSLLLRGDVVYLDLSPEVIFTTKEVVFTTEEALVALKEAILFNFRDIRNVIITIAGQEPGSFRESKPADVKR